MAKRRTVKRQKQSPGTHFEMLLDTPRAKVVRWILMPGHCTPRHKHPCPYIVIPHTDGLMRRVIYDGRKRSVKGQKLVAGKPYFRNVSAEGLEQTFCNVGDGPVIFDKCIICPPRGTLYKAGDT